MISLKTQPNESEVYIMRRMNLECSCHIIFVIITEMLKPVARHS